MATVYVRLKPNFIHFRCKYGKSSNPKLLNDLERDGLVVYTPSREIQGKKWASYDDRLVLFYLLTAPRVSSGNIGIKIFLYNKYIKVTPSDPQG